MNIFEIVHFCEHYSFKSTIEESMDLNLDVQFQLV